MSKGVGAIYHDQRGITIFEVVIILLIVSLIAVSCIITIRKITSESTQHYNTYEGVKSDYK